MKKFVTLMLLASLPGLAQTPVESYADACRNVVRGLTDRNRDLLYEAQATLLDIEAAEVQPLSADAATADATAAPQFLFTAEYVDSMLTTGFDLVALAPPHLMRADATEAEVYTIHRGVAPHSTLSYTLEGEGTMQATVVSYPANAVTLSVDGNPGTGTVTWSATGPFTLTLSNDTDTPATAAVILN